MGLPPTYSLADLVAESGLTERQIRTLLSEGVVPRADRRGRGARYPKSTLDRLKLVRLIREHGPPSTSLEQVRDLLDGLTPAEIAGLAEGRIPFQLIDDGEDRGTVGTLGPGGRVERRPPPPRAEAMPVARAAPALEDPDEPDDDDDFDADADADEPVVLSSADRLAAAPRSCGAGRDTSGRRRKDHRSPIALHPRERRSAAARQLDELVRRLEAVERAIGQRGRSRVGRIETDTWHRVAAGRELEIHARGPLAPEQLELLEDAARVLERLIHQPSLGDARLRVEPATGTPART